MSSPTEMDEEELRRVEKIAQETYARLERHELGTVGDGVLDHIKRHLSNDDMRKLGIKVWPYSYKGGASDIEAFSRLTDAVASGEIEPAFKILLNLPDEQCKLLWAPRWVDQGCPRVVMDPKFAYWLMAMDVGEAMLPSVVVPWKAFLLELPDHLLDTKDAHGNYLPIKRVLVQYITQVSGKDTFNIVAIAERGLQLWTHGVALEELTTNHIGEGRDWGYGLKCDSRDDRVMNMIGRLIISLCVALADPDNYHEQKRTKGRGSQRKRTHQGLAEITTFVVGKPVSINCRQAILDYINGVKRSGPKVQFLVRGHWKHQPYGPGRSQRKLIKIEPYWKGPEDAPILSRTVKP